MVSVPSVPRRLRAFVTSPFVTSSGGGGHVTGQVRVDLRWSRPAQPAGIISSYHVSMATSLIGDDTSNVTTLSGQRLDSKFSVVDAPISTMLYFKVRDISLFVI